MATSRCVCALTHLSLLPLGSSCFSSFKFCSFDVEIGVEAAAGLELKVKLVAKIKWIIVLMLEVTHCCFLVAVVFSFLQPITSHNFCFSQHLFSV